MIISKFGQLFDTVGELASVFIGICMILLIVKNFWSMSTRSMGPIVLRFFVAALVITSVPEMIKLASGAGDSLTGSVQALLTGVLGIFESLVETVASSLK